MSTLIRGRKGSGSQHEVLAQEQRERAACHRREGGYQGRLGPHAQNGNSVRGVQGVEEGCAHVEEPFRPLVLRRNVLALALQLRGLVAQVDEVMGERCAVLVHLLVAQAAIYCAHAQHGAHEENVLDGGVGEGAVERREAVVRDGRDEDGTGDAREEEHERSRGVHLDALAVPRAKVLKGNARMRPAAHVDRVGHVQAWETRVLVGVGPDEAADEGHEVVLALVVEHGRAEELHGHLVLEEHHQHLEDEVNQSDGRARERWHTG
mmetsp:Transcript_20182/g.68469  ORF Transcript_20182/g.68469 Transcript_20182/m.68469 type:complete len:264 (-) Transcript_20182:847-1638(-)